MKLRSQLVLTKVRFKLACRDAKDLTMGIGMLSAFMAFIEEGDEVIVFEPFFDQYVITHVQPELLLIPL